MKTLSFTCTAAALLLAACTPAPSPAPEPPAGPAASSSGQNAGGVAMPASLSAEERRIWVTLTEEAKRAAAEYIANGGTLTEFVAV